MAKKRAKTFEDEYASKIAKDELRYKSIKKEVKLLEQELKTSKRFLSTYKKQQIIKEMNVSARNSNI